MGKIDVTYDLEKETFVKASYPAKVKKDDSLTVKFMLLEPVTEEKELENVFEISVVDKAKTEISHVATWIDVEEDDEVEGMYKGIELKIAKVGKKDITISVKAATQPEA